MSFLQKVLFGSKQVERVSHYMRDFVKKDQNISKLFSEFKKKKKILYSFLRMWHLGGDFRVANLLDVEVRERKE